ncbi:MAG TPA: magnesium chelatase [Methylomirabilota bacterium]|jgi:magnesium chelatase subunit I|nr:magnesium chelatase [Methylomirabilota bacterium]
MRKPTTVTELRQSGYTPRSVKQELRDNLIARLKSGALLFSGIVGYEESVVPQIENAILSGQDIVFLGERGQAKTRMARLLVGLLDDEVPALGGCEINDDPLAPICQACRLLLAERGDKAPVAWVPRDRRYGEKLATPDITIADLIGEVDPIKVAEGRYLADELTIHYGLLPRTNRGIFTINELPDLAERIQVGLLNIMEERDVQIRGYKVRLPLDLYVVASANPEDYTNRGRIITPLKDRFGSQIRTHYPRRLEDEMAIMEAERTRFASDGFHTIAPEYMKRIVAELTHLARRAPEISQRSGVSVRVSICNYENLISNALKRAIRLGEGEVAPRLSDLGAIVASTSGKIELDTLGEASEEKVLGKLAQRAVLNVFNKSFASGELDEVVTAFQGGLKIEVSDAMSSSEYMRQIGEVRPLHAAVRRLGATGPAAMAAALEFVLEGLHLNKKLNKDVQAGHSRYRV